LDLSSFIDLDLLPVRVTAVALEPLRLPENWGSTVRGAFGGALKRLVCVHPQRLECPGCPVYDDCAFPALFQPRAAPEQAGTSGYRDLPRPYVVSVPALADEMLAPGDEFDWRFILIGRAVDRLPYFALAWREMGALGIGAARGRFRITAMEALSLDAPGRPFYDPDAGRLHAQGPTVTGDRLRRWAEQQGSVDCLRIEFRTPTCLKLRGEIQRRPEFPVLWSAVQLRLSTLRLAHGAGRPQMSFRETIDASAAIRLAVWDCREQGWQRYSRRQGRRVPMQGFTGEAVYEGDLTPFLPALKMAEITGVGDYCTFGQGRFRVRVEPQ
jgi:hypothetical protein